MKKYFCAKGMTLIEMIMAIGVFSLSVTGFTFLLSRTWTINHFVLEEGEASRTASRGVHEVVDTIRSARQSENGSYLLESAHSNDLIFYSDIDADGKTERVHYFSEAGSLKMGIRKPSDGVPPTYASGDESVSVLANYVVNEDGNVFSYYGLNGQVLSNPVEADAVRMIKVRLEINIDPIKAPNNINIESLATLRNLGEQNQF